MVIAYDTSMNVRTVVEVARGDYHQMDVPIAATLSAVLTVGANRFVVAHNHPSGDVTPTAADVDMTRKMLAAANTVGLYFENHFIIGPRGESMDFVSDGLMGRSQELAALAKGSARRRRRA